jgi:uncharacterized membrane protein
LPSFMSLALFPRIISCMRHHEVSRLEAFSDAVFGFALTLLVVSLETPKSFEDLKADMLGFVPFALMFAMVCWIWYEHNLFFRRYGMQDALTVFLNSVLLFVVLFYVYPLRFLTTALVGGLMGQQNVPDIKAADSWLLMLLYSIGVLLIFSTFVLLHLRAWRNRAAMDLSAVEALQLKYRIRSHAISAGIAVVSLLLLAVAPRQAMWAGIIYGSMGPLHGWNGYKAGQALSRLSAQ